ncbi:hypothetical protein HDV03_003810 [Kappamyces sp. JEL0829]|nr:hypothetical protein HDV03_003810 [Kappamyces sp. JEL0829]
MYLHWANFPFFVDWSKGGEKFGFRAGTVTTVKIPTQDGRLLGAWHVVPRRDMPLPSPYPSPNPEVDSVAETEKKRLDNADIVFLYCHGNAGNRATYHRTSFYKMMTTLSKNCHVIAFDYRGFADSTREIPMEKTLRIDAMSVYEWIVSQGVQPSRIIVVGHSLGSGIATDLVYRLTLKSHEHGTPMCRGLVLLSGYASIADAAIGYPNIPLLRPFHGIHALEVWIKNRIFDKLESHKKLGLVNVPILLIHGKCDRDIQPWQAKANFLEALGGRLDSSLVERNGYWALRNLKKPFSTKDIKGLVTTTLPGEEGELWAAQERVNPIWMLLVSHAGHNDLSIHHVVHDTIESWLKQKRS